MWFNTFFVLVAKKARILNLEQDTQREKKLTFQDRIKRSINKQLKRFILATKIYKTSRTNIFSVKIPYCFVPCQFASMYTGIALCALLLLNRHLCIDLMIPSRAENGVKLPHIDVSQYCCTLYVSKQRFWPEFNFKLFFSLSMCGIWWVHIR